MADKRMESANALASAAQAIANAERQMDELDNKVTVFVAQEAPRDSFRPSDRRDVTRIDSVHPLYVKAKDLFREVLELELKRLRDQYDKIEQEYFKVSSAGTYRPAIPG